MIYFLGVTNAFLMKRSIHFTSRGDWAASLDQQKRLEYYKTLSILGIGMSESNFNDRSNGVGTLTLFPHDVTINEVRDAIKNANLRITSATKMARDGNEVVPTKVFVEKDRGDYVIFNYLLAGGEHFFPTPNTDDAQTNREYTILRECRGLTFAKDGKLLDRKYHKFFNINERKETKLHAIDFSQFHQVLEKLDGSMITSQP